MDYVSFRFILFVGILFLLFYMAPGRHQWRVLLAGSAVFYLSFSVKSCIYICSTILTTYLSALWMEKNRGGAKNGEKKNKRILVLALAVNLGLLGLLKYSDFILTSVNQALCPADAKARFTLPSFLIPVGLSFYTFQMAGYLLDVYWGGAAEKNLGKYALYGSFFPQLLSGPIGRYSLLEEQLFAGKRFDYQSVVFGMQRAAWGFFKKLVIADRVGIVVDVIFNHYEQYHGVLIWVGIFAFVLQLYTDFSGCMDIVIGVAQIFQIKLEENFRQPFFSKNVSEFWRRWHITLGNWMKDYFFYTMLKSDWIQRFQSILACRIGKKRARKCGTYLGMMILWFVMGLWHGASWKFVWGTGLWYFICIFLGKILEPVFVRIRGKMNTECFSYQLFQAIRTTFIFSLGSLFFRASSFIAGFRMLGASMQVDNWNVLWDGTLLNLGIKLWEWMLLLAACVLLTCVSLFQRKHSVRRWLHSQNAVFRWLIYYLAVIIIFFMGKQGTDIAVGSFLYFQF